MDKYQENQQDNNPLHHHPQEDQHGDPPSVVNTRDGGRCYGFLELTYGVLFDPVATLRRVAEQPPLFSTVLIFTIVNIVNTVMALLTTARLAPSGEMEILLPGLMQALAPAVAVGGFLYRYAKWFVFSALLHLLAELLGGRGRAVGVFSVAGLASLPSLFLVPLNVLLMLIKAPDVTATVLTGVTTLAVTIWGAVLLVLGLREIHGFTTGRALTVLVIPLAFLVFIGLVVLVALTLGAASLPRDIWPPGV